MKANELKQIRWLFTVKTHLFCIKWTFEKNLKKIKKNEKRY